MVVERFKMSKLGIIKRYTFYFSAYNVGYSRYEN